LSRYSIARHRARSGGKARDSQRYRMLVTRVRGMLKTRINARPASMPRSTGSFNSTHRPSWLSNGWTSG
jgi:hypothetical protein